MLRPGLFCSALENKQRLVSSSSPPTINETVKRPPRCAACPHCIRAHDAAADDARAPTLHLTVVAVRAASAAFRMSSAPNNDHQPRVVPSHAAPINKPRSK